MHAAAVIVWVDNGFDMDDTSFIILFSTTTSNSISLVVVALTHALPFKRVLFDQSNICPGLEEEESSIAKGTYTSS